MLVIIQYSEEATGWLVWSVNPSTDTWFFLSPKHPDRLWAPPTALFSGYCSSSMGVEQPEHEVNCLPPFGAFMVWTGTLFLHFYIGYIACPESFFTDITLALQGYCVSFNHGNEELKILFKLFPPCSVDTSHLPNTAAVITVKWHSGPLVFKVNVVAACLIERYDCKNFGGLGVSLHTF